MLDSSHRKEKPVAAWGSERYHFKDATIGRSRMEWTTPSYEEISLNCEVSSYANAEL